MIVVACRRQTDAGTDTSDVQTKPSSMYGDPERTHRQPAPVSVQSVSCASIGFIKPLVNWTRPRSARGVGASIPAGLGLLYCILPVRAMVQVVVPFRLFVPTESVAMAAN